MRKKKNNLKAKRIKKYNDLKSDTLSIDNEYIKRKEKITSFFFNEVKHPVSKKELASILSVPKNDIKMLTSILDNLKNEGVIERQENGKYIAITKTNSYTGIFDAKSEGFGFVILQGEDDLYIPKENTNGALNGDKVVAVLDRKSRYRYQNRKCFKIIKIISRKNEYVVGTCYKARKHLFLLPIMPNIPSVLINQDKFTPNIKAGDVIKAKITYYGDNKRNLEGKFVDFVCKKDETNAYIKALYVSYGLDEKQHFPKNVEDQLENINDVVSKDELDKRIDKTKDNVYTIDSEDAKDLDDAICVKKRKDGTFDLSVHIADVSHYVKDGSALDKEAIKRGTSIYVPGSVIPMLPKKISNGVCSLNEGKLRLTLSVDMHIDKNGEVLDSKIYKSYIKSKKKMTYEKVYKCIIGKDREVLEEYSEYLNDIALMLELANILNKRRNNMGSINFNIKEAKVELDEEGTLIDIHPYDKNISNNIIEEFMLVANMTVAEKFFRLGAPFIYRVHEKPDEEKLKTLNLILAQYNKKIKSIKNVSPKDIAQLLEKFDTDEEKSVISTITLRTLKLAKYDSSCLGHFGLAFKYYCHFTSPIRRYPDLFIHRVISDYLKGKYEITDKKKEKYEKQSISYSIIASDMEKEASKIERDFDSMYMAIFMKEKIGEEFDGTVSSVTSFGLFVKLESTIEGLVHISDIKGYYDFDEVRCRLIGRNGNMYKIGDKVRVKVQSVDIRLKQINFVLV